MTQSSDRVVSVARPHGLPRVLDSTFNKTVVFKATDALVTISFTGLAVLDGRPTDQWIAEHLWGGAVLDDFAGKPMLGTHQLRPALHKDIVRSINALRDNLAPALTRCPDSHRQSPLTIIVAGWKWSRGNQPRPYFLALQRNPSSEARIVHYRRFGSSSPSHREPVPLLSASPRGYTSLADLDSLAQRWLDAEWEAEIDILADEYQRVASQWPTVSPDFISVTIPPMRFNHVIVRYNTPTPGIQPLSIMGVHVDASVVYSPWFVCSYGIQAPGIVAGCLPYRFQIDSTDVVIIPSLLGASDGLLSSISALPRRRLQAAVKSPPCLKRVDVSHRTGPKLSWQSDRGRVSPNWVHLEC